MVDGTKTKKNGGRKNLAVDGRRNHHERVGCVHHHHHDCCCCCYYYFQTVIPIHHHYYYDLVAVSLGAVVHLVVPLGFR